MDDPLESDTIRENYFNARESRFFDFRLEGGTSQYIPSRQNVEDNKKKIDVPPRLRPSAGVGRKRKPCKQSFLSTRPDDCRMFE